MPEMPEVQGLVGFLAERAVGRTLTRASVTSIAALKTFDPPVTALQAWLLFQEPFGPEAAIGMLLTAVGVALVQWRR